MRSVSEHDDKLMNATKFESSDGLDEIFARVREAGRSGEIPPPSRVARMSASVTTVRSWSKTALYEALTPALCGRHPHAALQLMHDCGLLAQVLPELDATVNFSQEIGRRHKDVWAHTKIVVWQCVPRPALRWAAALHDIGKVPTRRLLPDGRVTFHGHAELGERMFEVGPAQRIGFPPQVRARVAELIRWHLRPGQYDASWTDSAVRRFAREVGPALDDLLNLSRADITSKRPGRRKQCLRSISALARRIRALQRAEQRSSWLPAGLGRHLMDAFAIAPGPEIGALRARLMQLCEAGELERGREASYYVEALSSAQRAGAAEDALDLADEAVAPAGVVRHGLGQAVEEQR